MQLRQIYLLLTLVFALPVLAGPTRLPLGTLSPAYTYTLCASSTFHRGVVANHPGSRIGPGPPTCGYVRRSRVVANHPRSRIGPGTLSTTVGLGGPFTLMLSSRWRLSWQRVVANHPGSRIGPGTPFFSAVNVSSTLRPLHGEPMQIGAHTHKRRSPVCALAAPTGSASSHRLI